MARRVAGCAEMMEALVPGFEAAAVAALGDLSVGIAWTERADPLVRERVERAAALFPHARRVDVPAPEGTYRAFAWEAAQTHRDLFAEHGDLYGENVATKLERALTVTREEAEAAERARGLYRERIGELMDGIDLLVTPTLAMVAPAAGIGDLALRDSMLQFTYPWNAVGAPALAIPCGGAEDGLPASVQLVGRPGDDALVLAAGGLLERALAQSGRSGTEMP